MPFFDKDIPNTSYMDDYDDFWDVSRLVPKKKTAPSRFSTSEKTSDVTIGRAASEKYTQEDKKLNFNLYEAKESGLSNERSYTPEYARLIKKVTIKPSVDRFDFHDTFRKAALIYFDYKCPKCDFVPFYSYMPQYPQMTTEQKRYYFYWRDELRHGRYLKIDYSYIYLYVYEILNLPEKIGKEEGLKLLCDVWRAYRKQLPKIDSNFSVWVQDYCLVYALECPYDEISDFLFDIINASPFKEFYLSDVSKGGNAASAMIAYLSDYDWRRGKYAGGENSEIYRRHVESAMKCIFERVLADENIVNSELSKISRTAFPGSLCTHTVKCILEIEYYSISHSPKLREAVTAALKYTENKLRAYIGVKSRLSIKELPNLFKRVIDGYFEAEFRRIEKERAKLNAPEYECLYDAPEEKVSFESALEIEKASWRVTARLTEGIEEDDSDSEDFIASEDCPDNDEKSEKDEKDKKDEKRKKSDGSMKERYGLAEYEIRFIEAALLCEFDKEKNISSECGIPPATLAENINEAFSDNFGDVIICETEEGTFRIIDDYCEEISEWLR